VQVLFYDALACYEEAGCKPIRTRSFVRFHFEEGFLDLTSTNRAIQQHIILIIYQVWDISERIGVHIRRFLIRDREQVFEGVGCLLNVTEFLYDLVLDLNFINRIIVFPSLGLLVKK